MSERSLDEALDLIRSQTELTESQMEALVQIVRERSHSLVPSTTQPETTAPEQSWTMPRTPKLVSQHQIADLLGLPAVNVRVWHNRSKLPKPDAYIGTKPVWSRSTVKRWCGELVLLAQQS